MARIRQGARVTLSARAWNHPVRTSTDARTLTHTHSHAQCKYSNSGRFFSQIYLFVQVSQHKVYHILEQFFAYLKVLHGAAVCLATCTSLAALISLLLLLLLVRRLLVGIYISACFLVLALVLPFRAVRKTVVGTVLITKCIPDAI